MNSPLKVSIVTPSFNQAAYLEACIRSVLDQDHPDIEYIIMDGGSTDSSPEIIQRYAGSLAYWVSRPDGGQSAAINEGLRHAGGDIWGWMNADDAYLPGAVSRAVSKMAAEPEIDILYGDCTWVDKDGTVFSEHRSHSFSIRELLLGTADIPTGSAFFRRRVLDRIGGLDESLHFVMDIEYWLRARDCSFVHLPEMFSLYRAHPSAKTMDKARSESRSREFVRVYGQFWAQNKDPGLQRLRSHSMAGVYLYAADLAAYRDDRETCLFYLRKSLGFGLPAFQPRLARLLFKAILGDKPARSLQKVWRSVTHMRT